jgi:hypothetical protein
MLERPGWDRARLEVASTADVEAARMLLYARAMAPIVQEPYAARLEVAEIEAKKGKAREAAARRHESRRRETLAQAIRHQALIREALGLDVDDDAEADDEPG